MKKNIFLLLFSFALFYNSHSQNFISEKKEANAFPLVTNTATSIYTDEKDDWLIQKVAMLFQDDIERVTGKKPAIVHQISSEKNLIIIGSIGHSYLIDDLIRQKKISNNYLENKWEAYQVQLINAPLKGIDNALVIAGSDKRGAA